MSFGKSRAKRMSVDSPKITFRDVAGVDEAKEEERGASRVRGMREKEEEEGEEEEGGARAENEVYKYKPVARKVWPVSIPELGDEFRVVQR